MTSAYAWELSILLALVNERVQAVKKKDVKETVAKDTGLVQLLRLSPRQAGGSVSPITLRNAVNALLGAVFVDSGFRLQTVNEVASRLG